MWMACQRQQELVGRAGLQQGTEGQQAAFPDRMDIYGEKARRLDVETPSLEQP